MRSMKYFSRGGKFGKVLRCQRVLNKVGIGKSTLYDWLNPKSSRYDPTFPKQIRLGASSVGWLEDEIDAWLQARVEASRE